MRTSPTGVRFDPEKLEFIKSKEKLTTKQQVVDFLVNKYWWEHKMPIPTHKESPPLSLKLINEQTAQPQISRPITPKKTPDQWIAEKREIEGWDTEGYNKWFEALEASGLPRETRNKIKMA